MDPVTAAVTSWAVSQIGSAGLHTARRLLPDKQQSALRGVVREAIGSAVINVVAEDDRDVVLQGLSVEVSDSRDIGVGDVLELRAAVQSEISPRLAALAEQGYEVDPGRLAEEIAARIAAGIRVNAARGGVLEPLAKMLRDERLVAAAEASAGTGRESAAQLQAISRSLEAWTGTRGDPSSGDETSAGPRVPPRRVSNLPARNPFFTGRTEELARIDDLLGQEPPAIVSVQGLGGVGKTELVLEYAWIHRNRYAIIWWIHASSQVELTADLIRLSLALGLDSDVDPDRAINSMRDELASRSDWLLIFDDAHDAAAIRTSLPSGGGRVLISSRARNWTGVAKLCPVEEMARQEAIDFFRVSTGRDSSEAAELAEELGCLPLALAQAAGYIAVRGCSAARYLELYRSAAHRMLAEGPRPPGYPDTVATTWLLHFESLSAPAIDLLRLVSFLAPEAIPLGLLFDSAREESLPETLRDVAGDPITREAAIGELVNAFLLIRLDDHTFRVHRLVQEITRSRLEKRERAIWLRRVAEFIVAAFPSQPHLESNWNRMSLLAPHAQVVAMQVSPHQKAADAAVSLLHGVGLYLLEQEQWDVAQDALERALNLALPTDKAHLKEAHIRLGLANIHTGRHDFKAAIEQSKQSLIIMEKIFGPAHPQLIAPLLAIAYNYQGDHDDEKAYQYFDRVAEILSRGADLPANVALGALMGLGNGMMSVGELDVAERNLENALSLATGMHGEHSHDAAQVHALLAWVHHHRGDQALADAQMSMAIDVIGELFGADHPYTRRLINRREEWRTSPQPEDP